MTVEEGFRLFLEGNEYMTAEQVDWSKGIEFRSEDGNTWYEFTDTRGFAMRCFAGRIR